MITVIVDTTTTFNDVMMSKTPWMRLLTLCARGDLQLVISEVVLRETGRHWKRESDKAVAEATERFAKIAKSRKTFEYLDLEPKIEALPTFPHVVVDVDRFFDNAVGRLAPLGVDIRALPSVNVATVLQRDLAGRKPFESTGKGFRDALIWETLVELVLALPEEDVVYCVTNNLNDFCLDGDLHPDLRSEIAEAPPEVRHVDSLETLLDLAELAPLVSAIAKTDEELAEYLTAAGAVDPDFEAYTGPSVGEVVTSALVSGAEALFGEEIATGDGSMSGLDFTPLHVPSQFENAYVSSVEPDEDTATWQTYETYEGGTLYIRGEIEAEVSLLGYVYKSEALVAGDEISVTDWDWNDHYVEAEYSTRARLIFHVVAEPGQDFAENCEFEVAEPVAPLDNDHPWPKSST